MKKYILIFILSGIIIFTINSQENVFENTFFLYNLYSKNNRSTFDIDFMNLNPWILKEFDMDIILKNNFFENENGQNTKGSATKIVNDVQDYSGLSLLLGMIVYYTVPNNLRYNKQQQEMMQDQLNKNMEYNKIINNNGYNGFR
jgi:hypothetical protein